jgi:hypothetical protein
MGVSGSEAFIREVMPCVFPFSRLRFDVKARKATLEDVEVFYCPHLSVFCCNNYPS